MISQYPIESTNLNYLSGNDGFGQYLNLKNLFGGIVTP
jgi:hypothetical protein